MLAISVYNFLVSVLIGSLVILLFKRRKKYKTLPGPIPLPFLGNVLSIGQRPHKRFAEWGKIYGPLFQIKMGGKDLVILNDPTLIKEVLKDSVSNGRSSADNPVIYEFSKGPYGVLMSDGANWEDQRRFTLTKLKDHGFTKMETLIMEEVATMITWFDKHEGQPISGNRIFNAPVVNSLWQIVSGERHNWEEKRPLILDLASEFFDSLAIVCTNGVLFAPVLKRIAPEYFSWNRYVSCGNKLFEYIKQTINDHRDKLEPHSPRDFIDMYLLEIQHCTDPKSSFYKELGYKNLLTGVFDLFVGGSETTSHTLSWSLLYLSHYLSVQDKLQAEIDEIIGTSRLPTLSDKNRMPYLEAVMLEILRVSTVLSMGVAHRITRGKTFQGYYLHRNTSVFANLYGVHHDPDIWGDPHTFRPERFLNSPGTKVVRHPALIPFAEGRRRCMGENLARDTLFLFLCSIFQRFHVLPEPDMKNRQVDFEADIGYFLVPKPFKVVMLDRSNHLD